MSGNEDRRDVVTARFLAAAAALTSAAVHLWLWFDGVRHQDVIGPAFMMNAIGGAVIAVLLLTWKHWLPLLLAIGFGVSTLGAFIVSTTVGLFGIHASWAGWDEWVSAVSEVILIVVGLWLVRAEGWLASVRAPQH
ncbi:hypothetical protein ASD81_16075 [Nocardioides sp. Root614]|nr:hypothetical protein ASD81_16075 [Nocardioides sp. Root614]KRA87634.1 hypothetical protein ASD84_16350 [Nocardioides sp. Root682]